MNFAKSCFLTAISFSLFLFSQAEAAVITVPGDHATISLAITAAVAGDVINVADGIYNENLVIDKSLSLIGNSEAGVIINVPATNVRGIVVNSGINNVTIQNLTINRPNPFHASPAVCTNCSGIRFAGPNSGFTLNHITINNAVKSGVIIEGHSAPLLGAVTNVTSSGSLGGNGLFIIDSDGIRVDDSTFIGNAVADVSFHTRTGSISDTILSASNNLGATPIVIYNKTNPTDVMTPDVAALFSHEVYGNWAGTAPMLAFFPGNTPASILGIYTEDLDAALAGAPFLERVIGEAPGGIDINPSTLPGLLAGLLAAPDPDAYLDLNLPPSSRLISPVILQALDNSLTVPDEDHLTLGYQAAQPQFNSLALTAQDALAVAKAAVAGTFYVGIGEKIHFNLELNPADSVGTGNSFVPFNIGATSVQTANLISSATPVTNRTRTYNVNPGENGLVGITGVTFFDAVGLAIENLPGAFAATNIVVDTTAPTILSVTQVGSGSWPRFVKEGETVTYSITYSEDVSVTVNAASTAANATGALTDVSAASATTDTIIATVAAGDNGTVVPTVNFDITDIAGNVTTITSLGAITGGGGGNVIIADTTLPTLTSVSISSDNLNSDWAKTGDTITLSFTADEDLRNGNVVVMILGQVATVTPGCGFGTCTSYTAAITTNGTEPEGVAAFSIDFLDQAANAGLQVTGTTDATVVTFDKTAPTLPLVSIASNNALNTALAKSNDTITVTFTVADNLATVAVVNGSPTILSSAAVANITTVAAGQTISRFTDGSETSEVVAPFSFAVQDQAGNVSATTTATTDGSEVKFDRTDPIVTNVGISATSADLSAFMGDVPTYYAKQGDTLDFVLQICDYVDSDTNPPTGTVFGAAATFVDQGLVGAPGNCTTGAGNLSQFREWKVTMAGIDGTEGVISFSVDGKDNAGNTLVPSITVTTNGSSVIFDKTMPTVPTDMVDLGGAATAGYKPAPNADLYTWTNDADPAGGTPQSGVYQFDIRYNNVNTGINEMVTLTAPNRSFAPTLMIPDLAAYTVNMNVRDKAGNPSSEQVVYTQKYGIEVSGTVLDTETGLPIEGAIVAVIAPAGSTCNLPGQEVCTSGTDAAGKYTMTVAPNTQYKLDVTKAARYYIAKSDLTVTASDVVSNVSLQPVAEGEIQTGNQGTVITTDAEFSLNGIEQTTYITAFSQSGEITTTVTPAGLQITSFGTITGITSNNPDVVVEDQGNNVFLVKNAGNVLSTSDNQNRGSSVSSSYASGSNRVGVRRAQGGASAGFQTGMSRGDRVVNGGIWTEEESLAFARQLNQGTGYKVMQYRNRNGYMVFAGYQAGRMAMSDMTGSNPALMLSKQVVYRGPRRGTEQTFRNIAIADRKEVVHSLFAQESESTERKVLVVEEGNQQKAARPIVETKKTAFTYDNPEISGFGRPVSVYPGVINKKENDARYVNKFARVNTPATVAPSRLQGKNVNMIVFRANNKRSSKKLVLGQLFNQNPELVTGRTRVVRR